MQALQNLSLEEISRKIRLNNKKAVLIRTPTELFSEKTTIKRKTDEKLSRTLRRASSRELNPGLVIVKRNPKETEIELARFEEEIKYRGLDNVLLQVIELNEEQEIGSEILETSYLLISEEIEKFRQTTNFVERTEIQDKTEYQSHFEELISHILENYSIKEIFRKDVEQKIESDQKLIQLLNGKNSKFQNIITKQNAIYTIANTLFEFLDAKNFNPKLLIKKKKLTLESKILASLLMDCVQDANPRELLLQIQREAKNYTTKINHLPNEELSKDELRKIKILEIISSLEQPEEFLTKTEINDLVVSIESIKSISEHFHHDLSAKIAYCRLNQTELHPLLSLHTELLIRGMKENLANTSAKQFRNINYVLTNKTKLFDKTYKDQFSTEALIQLSSELENTNQIDILFDLADKYYDILDNNFEALNKFLLISSAYPDRQGRIYLESILCKKNNKEDLIKAHNQLKKYRELARKIKEKDDEAFYRERNQQIQRIKNIYEALLKSINEDNLRDMYRNYSEFLIQTTQNSTIINQIIERINLENVFGYKVTFTRPKLLITEEVQTAAVSRFLTDTKINISELEQKLKDSFEEGFAKEKEIKKYLKLLRIKSREVITSGPEIELRDLLARYLELQKLLGIKTKERRLYTNYKLEIQPYRLNQEQKEGRKRFLLEDKILAQGVLNRVNEAILGEKQKRQYYQSLTQQYKALINIIKRNPRSEKILENYWTLIKSSEWYVDKTSSIMNFYNIPITTEDKELTYYQKRAIEAFKRKYCRKMSKVRRGITHFYKRDKAKKEHPTSLNYCFTEIANITGIEILGRTSFEIEEQINSKGKSYDIKKVQEKFKTLRKYMFYDGYQYLPTKTMKQTTISAEQSLKCTILTIEALLT